MNIISKLQHNPRFCKGCAADDSINTLSFKQSLHVAQMCIQRILLLSVLCTKGDEGSSPHSLPFISTLLILFQQNNQLYSLHETELHIFSWNEDTSLKYIYAFSYIENTQQN